MRDQQSEVGQTFRTLLAIGKSRKATRRTLIGAALFGRRVDYVDTTKQTIYVDRWGGIEYFVDAVEPGGKPPPRLGIDEIITIAVYLMTACFLIVVMLLVLYALTGAGMIYPTADDIGRAVVHTPDGRGRREVGVITSYNEHFVFVRYGRAGWGSMATSPRNLEWLSEKETDQ